MTRVLVKLYNDMDENFPSPHSPVVLQQFHVVPCVFAKETKCGGELLQPYKITRTLADIVPLVDQTLAEFNLSRNKRKS